MKIETWKPYSILLLFVALSLLTRWLSLCVDILDLDEAGHIVGSWQLMQGKLLYTEFIDNKPPLLYVYYAFAQILFGRGMFSVHLLTALVTVPLTAWGIYRFFENKVTGIYAGIVFLVYSASFLAHDMLAANTEILMILPATWALVLINTPEKGSRATNAAAASFLIATAVLFKHQIVFWLPAIVTAISYECIRTKSYTRWLKLGIASAFGFCLPLLTTYVVFAIYGGEDALFHWTITNNFSYAANPISLTEATGRAISYLLPFLLVTAPLWFYAFKSLRRNEAGYRRILSIAMVLWTIPTAFIGFRFFPHYFVQLYVPLTIAAAPHIAFLFLGKKGRIFANYSLALLVLCNIANGVLYFGNVNVYRERDPVYRKVAEVLRNDSCYNGATLFVWGYAPMFYYYAELPPASRFAVLSHGGLTGYVPGNLGSVRNEMAPRPAVRKDSWKLLMDDLEGNTCTFILDTAPAAIYRWDQFPMEDYPQLHDYVARKFQLRSSVDQVAVYRRSGCTNEGL